MTQPNPLISRLHDAALMVLQETSERKLAPFHIRAAAHDAIESAREDLQNRETIDVRPIGERIAAALERIAEQMMVRNHPIVAVDTEQRS